MVLRQAEAVEVPVDGALPRAELAEWRERFGLVAGITGRGDAADPFDVGLRSDAPAGRLAERWRALRDAFSPGFTAFQVGHQVHGVETAWHADVPPGWHVRDDLDGHASSQHGLLLLVSAADCVPVYLTARDGSAWALLHAGWRGVAGGMLESGLAALRDGAGVSPDDVVMHCGVAICRRCYEVGPEVARAVLGTEVKGPSKLDLRAALAARALAAGVAEVTTSPLCTSCDRDRYFSYRGGDAAARQFAYLGRPEAE